MIDFTGVTAIAIPEGNVVKIMRGSEVLWEKQAQLDEIAPEISIGGTTGNTKWFNTQTFNITVTEENLDYIQFAWNQSNNENSMKRACDGATPVYVTDMTSSELGVYTYSITAGEGKNGRYVFNVKAVDKSGNVTYKRKSWYQFDTIAPVITGVENGGTYNEIVTPVISDKNISTITLNGETFVSGTEIKLSGTYVLVAIDKAGNKTTLEFTIV